ncbi:expressed unknown protein [Seminavis robusta]|uniref:Uncharacterized protein n=1 Tax=Seminavis robusta TaxID=568900 RepID=A0A9N8DJH8_9STRA|nr:expressed unknown protein [Seminavis robusta]|eukprot:Sro191_g082330.1 n/a (504) ;mRNA; r:69806-71317
MAAKQFVDQQAPSRKNKFRYLNAGVILGTPQTLVSIFKWVLPYMKEHRVDDQAALVKFWQHNPNKITLDYESEICGIISPVPQFLARDWDYSPLIEGLLDSSADHATRATEDVLRGVATKQDQGFMRKYSHKRPGLLHFAGVKYLDETYNKHATYNRCQQHLLHVYNVLGRVLLMTSREDEEGYTGSHDSITTTSLPHDHQPQPAKRRVVVSLTTTPPRIVGIFPVLLSLERQSRVPDAIYLNVPQYSKRFNQEYVVPKALQKLSWLTLNMDCEDYGPATKLIPTLEKETDPDTLIINVDDEYIYPPDFVESLVHQHLKAPYIAFANAGQMIDTDHFSSTGVRVRSACHYYTRQWKKQLAAVDILEAFQGAIFRRDFFSLESIKNIPSNCFGTDDIWISAELAKKGITRVRIPFTQPDNWTRDAMIVDKLAPLRINSMFGESKNDRCALELLPHFQKSWRQTMQRIPIGFEWLDYPKALPKNAYYDEEYNADRVTSPCSMPIE